MGVALFPVLEKQIEGLDINFCGKMLARITDKELEKRTDSLEIQSLTSFLGIDPNIIEDFDIELDEEISEKWFSAESGLNTVEILIKDLKENHNYYLIEERVIFGAIDDLVRLREILIEAKNHQVRWYLTYDF